MTDCPCNTGGQTVPADSIQDRPHTKGGGLPAGPQQAAQRRGALPTLAGHRAQVREVENGGL